MSISRRCLHVASSLHTIVHSGSATSAVSKLKLVLFGLMRILVFLCSWFPRVAVHFLLAWAAYCTYEYAPQLGHPWVGATVVIINGVAFVLASYAYFQVWFTGPGSPRDFDELVVGDSEQRAGAVLPTVMQDTVEAKHDGGPRFCQKCSCFKPDRAHHCRLCGECVLRMDHHCPWFACCIGFENHRYFIQFMGYALILSVVSTVLSIVCVVLFFKYELYTEFFLGMNFVFYLVLAPVFSLILLSFGGYSLYQVLINRTTLESLEPAPYRTPVPASQWRFRRPPDPETLGNMYNLGVRANLAQLMGRNWLEWLLPLEAHLSTDGTFFAANEELRLRALERANLEIELCRRKQQYDQNTRVRAMQQRELLLEQEREQQRELQQRAQITEA